MHSHVSMSFPSLHFTTLTHSSYPRHSLHPFTSLHFTSLHFRARRFGFDSRQRQEIVLCFIASRPALGATQPPIQWTPGVLSPGLNRPGRVADHSPLSTAEVKHGGAIRPFSHTSSWCVQLIKHREKFYFYMLQCRNWMGKVTK
jgi:hypothetical protein